MLWIQHSLPKMPQEPEQSFHFRYLHEGHGLAANTQTHKASVIQGSVEKRVGSRPGVTQTHDFPGHGTFSAKTKQVPGRHPELLTLAERCK